MQSFDHSCYLDIGLDSNKAREIQLSPPIILSFLLGHLSHLLPSSLVQFNSVCYIRAQHVRHKRASVRVRSRKQESDS